MRQSVSRQKPPSLRAITGPGTRAARLEVVSEWLEEPDGSGAAVLQGLDAPVGDRLFDDERALSDVAPFERERLAWSQARVREEDEKGGLAAAGDQRPAHRLDLLRLGDDRSARAFAARGFRAARTGLRSTSCHSTAHEKTLPSIVYVLRIVSTPAPAASRSARKRAIVSGVTSRRRTAPRYGRACCFQTHR